MKNRIIWFLLFLLVFPFSYSFALMPPSLKFKEGEFSILFEKDIPPPKKSYVPTSRHNLDAVSSVVRKNYIRPGVDLKQCAGEEAVQKIISAPNEQVMAELLNDVLARCLDRYSFYKTSSEAERERDGQWMSSVGIELAEVPAAGGQTSVIISGVVPDSPVETAGLLENDVVLGVGDSLVGNAGAAVRALAGNAGEAATVAVLRGGKTHIFIFARRPFDVIPISAYLFPEKIAYAKIYEESASAAAWLRIALKKMSEQEPSGLILDFRGNSGGMEIFSAACMVGLFVSDPMHRVATMHDRIGENPIWARECKKIFREWPQGEFSRFTANKKLAVLVNESTASMAELVVANLQQLGAIVIGAKTYGKGSGFSVFDKKDDNGILGQLHLITDQVLAGEKKQRIEGIGVIPDMETSSEDYSEPLFLSDRVPNPDRDPQLKKAIEFLKAE